MAKMIPKRPHPDTKSQAELRLFDAFEQQLPKDYTVFHSVSWQLRNSRSGAKDGETDFLVAHPDFGLLIVEVKGGHIRYDGLEDQWYTYDIKIKDPFKQGRNNKYSLLEKLKELPYWRNRWITVGYAAAFPDVSVKGDLRLDAPRELILDQSDMNDLPSWLKQALTFLRGRRSQDDAVEQTGVAELINTLSPSVDLPPLLSAEIESQVKEQERLTREQFMMLDFLGRRRQAAISGCAGSGKTMLAYEKARRLAEQGFKVLLTCFNVNLAEWLDWESEDTRPANLRIVNFHHIADELVQQVGLPGGPYNSEYFEKVLPERLGEAVDQLGAQFDAIIVDEGQDFLDNWWLPLQMLLHDPDQGIFYVFYDDNQNIYRGAGQMPLESAPFPLPHNCRNTQYIHRQVLNFYHSEQPPTAIGPQGRPVEHQTYATSNELKRLLRQVLHRLVMEEEVPAWDIVILTPKARQRSQLWQLGPLGNFHLVDEPTDATGDIYCTTIHKFKGLESPVVILAEIDNDQIWNLETILYVGCSRARNHLILLTAADLSDKIKTKLAE
ncbi:MAG: ATP-binding domain-containing protein [Chloroflexi bacterium]|nr:ATP-binding domain-containing protein [Chloroflexota bacterium]